MERFKPRTARAPPNTPSALNIQSAAHASVQNATTQLTNAQNAVEGLQQTLQIKRNAEIRRTSRPNKPTPPKSGLERIKSVAKLPSDTPTRTRMPRAFPDQLTPSSRFRFP